MKPLKDLVKDRKLKCGNVVRCTKSSLSKSKTFTKGKEYTLFYDDYGYLSIETDTGNIIRVTLVSVAEFELSSLKKWCPDGFTRIDVDELWRIYYYPDGGTLHIAEPKVVFVKKGPEGHSHRVVDSDGVTYYPAAGWIGLSWKVPDGGDPFVA